MIWSALEARDIRPRMVIKKTVRKMHELLWQQSKCFLNSSLAKFDKLVKYQVRFLVYFKMAGMAYLVYDVNAGNGRHGYLR